MVVFKAKIWPMQKQTNKKGCSDARWSQAEWAARPVVSNSCA